MPNIFSRKLSEDEMANIVSAKVTWINKFSSPTEIYLFGSASTKTMTEASDIDLILVYQLDEDVEHARLSLVKNRPSDDWPHDLIFTTSENFRVKSLKMGSIYHEACAFGTKIYSKGD
jgi:predicted nucleotidyltransferase